MECHRCHFSKVVQSGRYKNVPFYRTPCSRCQLVENSEHTLPVNEDQAAQPGSGCDPDPSNQEDTPEQMMPISVLTAFVALLLTLPPKTRNTVCWRHQGVPYKEIAAKNNTTMAAAEVLHRRAMDKHPELRALFSVKTAKQSRRRKHAAPITAV